MLIQQLRNEGYHLLAVRYVTLPNAVAAHQNEPVALVAVDLSYLGHTCHALVLVTVLLVPFVLKVPKRTRQTQGSIHPPLAHEPSCLLDSVVLPR